MFIHYPLLVGNPFLNAFFNSDLFGKAIFIALIIASIVSWTLIIYKFWMTKKAKTGSFFFKSTFQKHLHDPLAIPADHSPETINPYLQLYGILKKQSLELLRKNLHYGASEQGQERAYLSGSDISLIESHLAGGVATQTQNLESNLFILSTIVSLGPFIGLLGTVWGIIISFGEMQNSVASNQAILGGISLALATTVLGLLNAIPALIGYNYFKNSNRSFSTEMECFCNEMLAAVELHYRKVDLK